MVGMYESLVVMERSFGSDLDEYPYRLVKRRFDNPIEADYDTVCKMTRAQAIAVVSTNLANAFTTDLGEYSGQALK